MPDIHPNQLKLKVSDSYEKYEKITTFCQFSSDEDVMNKAYLDEKLSNIEDHLSFLEKNYIEFKLKNDEQSVEEVPILRVLKTTMQMLHDNGLFGGFSNEKDVFVDFLFVEKRRPDLDILNDVV